MFDKLNAVEQRYEETLARLGTAELQSDPSEYRKQAKAASEMAPLVECFREYKVVARSLAETEELASADADRQARGAPLSTEDPAHPQGSERREEHHSRNPGGNRR
jgi:peptide chain release factor 1